MKGHKQIIHSNSKMLILCKNITACKSQQNPATTRLFKAIKNMMESSKQPQIPFSSSFDTPPTHTHTKDHISEQCISHQMEQSQMKKIDCMILKHKYF